MKRYSHRTLLLLLPFAVGVLATLLFAKLRPDIVISLLHIEPSRTVAISQPTAAAATAPETALDMSFNTLTDSIGSERGFALDHYALSYLIITHQQMTGLLRTVARSDANEKIRAAAAFQLDRNEEDTSQLLVLQKELGHLHH